MKNKHLVPLTLTLSLVMLVGLFSCRKKQTYSLFGHKIERETGGRVFESDERYLKVCNLRSLTHVWIPAIKTSEAVKKALSQVLPGDFPLNEVVTVMLYSTQNDTSRLDISLDQVPALSVIRISQNDYIHDYLEQEKGKFTVVPQFSGKINGGLTMDDVTMLHFASSRKEDLPDATVIYQLRWLPESIPALQGDPNVSIGDVLMADMKRNNGLTTFDMYGEDFYKVMLLDNDPGQGRCGNNTMCPGGSTSCIPPPADELDKEFPGRCASSGGCCNAVLVAARAVSSDGKAPFDLKELFEYRHDFAMKYELGRRYCSYFGLVGRHMKMEPGAMQNYIEVVTTLDKLMRTLKDSSNDPVIFDDAFNAVFTTFINYHRGSGSKHLETALDQMASDLEKNKGMTRSQLMKLLEDSNRDTGK